MFIFHTMLITLVLLSLTLTAFSLRISPPIRAVSPLKMAYADLSSVPGTLPPTGFFDPLGLSDVVDEKWNKRYREAELKHGRVAML